MLFLYTGKVFGLMENQLAMQKARKETEKFKVEARKLKVEEQLVRKPEVKPEYVPNEATIKKLFSVQQVSTCKVRNKL